MEDATDSLGDKIFRKQRMGIQDECYLSEESQYTMATRFLPASNADYFDKVQITKHFEIWELFVAVKTEIFVCEVSLSKYIALLTR